MLVLVFMLMLLHGLLQLLLVQGGRLKGPAPHPVGQGQLHGLLYILRIDLCSPVKGGNGLGGPGDDNLSPVRLDAQIDAGRGDGPEKIIAHAHFPKDLAGLGDLPFQLLLAGLALHGEDFRISDQSSPPSWRSAFSDPHHQCRQRSLAARIGPEAEAGSLPPLGSWFPLK